MTLLAIAAAAKSPSAWDEPGTLGFLVVFGLAIILYFLLRSMSRHLRKVREAASAEAAAKVVAGEQAHLSDDGAANDHETFRPAR